MNRKVVYVVAAVALIALGCIGVKWIRQQAVVAAQNAPWRQLAKKDEQRLLEAYQKRQQQVQVAVTGRVIKLLPDDENRPRHQRFIIEVGNGMTLQVAHNLDLAPRVPGLEYGNQISAAGEYSWNEQGGVLLWTHRDKEGQHPDGWLEFNGVRYQ